MPDDDRHIWIDLQMEKATVQRLENENARLRMLLLYAEQAIEAEYRLRFSAQADHP